MTAPRETPDEIRYLEDDARAGAIADAARFQEMLSADELDEMEREIYAERAEEAAVQLPLIRREPYWVQRARPLLARWDAIIADPRTFADLRPYYRERRDALADRVARWEAGLSVGGWPVDAGADGVRVEGGAF